MRILLYSPAFLPLVGGLENVTAMLAQELTRQGHSVVVVTKTPASDDRFPYRVSRNPSPLELLRLTRWCNVYLQANVSLRGLWPLLLVRRPWVVAHHSFYRRCDGTIPWRERLKRRLSRHASAALAVSRAVAEDFSPPAQVAYNPYDEELFRPLPGVERCRELLFVGRLVSDKGADLLVEALSRLAEQGLRPQLTIVGDGPELPALRQQAARLSIGSQVTFLGRRTGEELVRLFNQHRVLVVPSRFQEPFGIVALEGIACGCLVVGSQGGGLAEAIGPCGWTFPNDDVEALARALERALAHPSTDERMERQRARHLARHSRERSAARYLEILRPLVEERA